MSIVELIRLILGVCFLLGGVVLFAIELISVFDQKYVLNRMHGAAIGDTLALSSILVGLMIFSGFNFDTLKLIIVDLFLWVTSPVSSHLVARLEAYTGKDVKKFVREASLEEIEKELEEEEGKA